MERCEGQNRLLPIYNSSEAGWTDGHVESFSSSQVIPMQVSITSDGYTPYPVGVGPGIFYLPANAISK